MKTFSIEESLRFGWHKTRAHSGLLFQVMLTFFALQIANAVVGSTLEHSSLGVAAGIIFAVIGVFMATGFMHIALALAEGEPASYADLFPDWRVVWRYTLVSVASGAIVLLGFLALIIPGIYFLLRFSFVRFAVLRMPHEKHYVRKSLAQSSKATEGLKWRLLGFFVVFALLNLLGAMLFLVGLLLTVPVTMLAYAHVYLKLKGGVELSEGK